MTKVQIRFLLSVMVKINVLWWILMRRGTVNVVCGVWWMWLVSMWHVVS